MTMLPTNDNALIKLLGKGGYNDLDIYDPAAERRNNLYQLMISQAMQNPSMTSPLLAFVGALGYGRGNNAQQNKINQLKQGKAEFLKGVQQISQSNKTPDEKINDLVNLQAQYGTDYGLGIKDIVDQYGKMAERGNFNTLYNNQNIPQGFEVTEFDYKGRPKITKVKRDLQAEKFDAAKKEDEVVQKRQLENERSFAQDMIETIDEIEKGIRYFGAAGVIPPMPAEYSKVNWRANFDKLTSKNVLQTMTDLKKQSKTGATGFGQLSEKEMGVLQNASMVLKRNMSEEDAIKYLQKMKQPLQKVLGGAKEPGIKVGTIDSGYRFKGGNPADPKSWEKIK